MHLCDSGLDVVVVCLAANEQQKNDTLKSDQWLQHPASNHIQMCAKASPITEISLDTPKKLICYGSLSFPAIMETRRLQMTK